MDESRSWRTLFQIGGHSFLATTLLVALAATVGFWATPYFSLVLGSGWVAPLFVGLFFFWLLLLFRQLLLHQAWQTADEADEALLEYFVQQNNSTGAGEEVAVELLENALHLKTVQARACMTPRADMVCHDIHAPVAELRQRFSASGLSRIVVTDGSLDNMRGYVHVRQLLALPADVHDALLPISFVPETTPVNDLLRQFIRTRTNIACVVDEHGAVAGLVTLEDALEQLVGAIEDEHDPAP